MLITYDVWKDIWPDARPGQPIAPVRVGVHSRTGKMLGGFGHVQQSLYRLFATKYHVRVMRYYTGSFVPHLIGQNTVPSVITKFWWAIATSCELWEPGYGIKRVSMLDMERQDGSVARGVLTSADDIRRGRVAFQTHGEWYPRGHLGDKTPAGTRDLIFAGDGRNRWITYQPSNAEE